MSFYAKSMNENYEHENAIPTPLTKVAIIEDEESTRQILKIRLAKLNIIPDFYVTAEAALEMIPLSIPEVIMTDVNLSWDERTMKGNELIEELNRKVSSVVKYVLMSANDPQKQVEELHDKGITNVYGLEKKRINNTTIHKILNLPAEVKPERKNRAS